MLRAVLSCLAKACERGPAGEGRMNRLEVVTRGDGPFSDQLAPGVGVRILASGALGARGLTTALACFQPGAQLPYYRHPCSEVIVVLEGQAAVLVEGRRYRLEPYDAIHLPAGTAHAAANPSAEVRALLHSSFASDAPPREPVADTFAVANRDEPGAGCPESLVRFAAAAVYELAPRAFFRDL